MPLQTSANSHSSKDVFSILVYDTLVDPKHFDPSQPFTKWACTELPASGLVPAGMQAYNFKGGLYAVFTYRGKASAAGPAFDYIYNTWLPASGYELDHRPHLAIMGEKYKNEDPDSEEELCIPVRPA